MTKFVRHQNPQKTRTFSVLAALALLLGAASVFATPASGQAKPEGADHGRQHGPGMGGRLFERWDKDNDGRITIAELPARMQTHVRSIDLNKDGILTREEFDKGRQQLQALREKELDKNGDGKVTEEERREAMRAHVVERFVEQDKNHDGFLVEAEVAKPAWEHMKVADVNSDSKITLDEPKTAFDEGKLRPPPGKFEAEMKAHAQERFNAEDKNKDGFLTEAEVPKQKWEHIKVADTNRDNKVSFEELTAAFKSGNLGPRGPHRGPEHEGGNHREQHQ
jgi:Ca2+-binding EF-hand superfamily protein